MSRKVSMQVLWGALGCVAALALLAGMAWRNSIPEHRPQIMAFLVLADASSLVSLQYGSMKFCGVHVLGSIGRP
jgi:hypothetical protein